MVEPLLSLISTSPVPSRHVAYGLVVASEIKVKLSELRASWSKARSFPKVDRIYASISGRSTSVIDEMLIRKGPFDAISTGDRPDVWYSSKLLVHPAKRRKIAKINLFNWIVIFSVFSLRMAQQLGCSSGYLSRCYPVWRDEPFRACSPMTAHGGILSVLIICRCCGDVAKALHHVRAFGLIVRFHGCWGCKAYNTL